MDYSPTLPAYTNDVIPELGDCTDFSSKAKERECVVLSFFPAMLASYSRILVEGVVVRVNINMLYTKRGKITKPVPRTELEKLPKTVAYQESFNFYTKKPDEIIPVSGLLSAIDKKYRQQLKSAAYFQMYGVHPREWQTHIANFDYGQAETTVVGYLDSFDSRRNPYAQPIPEMVRRQLMVDNHIDRLRGEVNRLYQNINNPRDYG